MTVLIKLFYAGAVAALLVLVIAFGIRTFYPPPEPPETPEVPPEIRFGWSPVPTAPTLDGQTGVPPRPTPAQLAFEEVQQRYHEEYLRYEEDRAEYGSRVFIAAALLGIVAAAGGLQLSSRLDALRLGIVGGGLGSVLYGLIQAAGDLDEAGPAVAFIVVGVGLAVLVIAGQRRLGARPGDSNTGPVDL